MQTQNPRVAGAFTAIGYIVLGGIAGIAGAPCTLCVFVGASAATDSMNVAYAVGAVLALVLGVVGYSVGHSKAIASNVMIEQAARMVPCPQCRTPVDKDAKVCLACKRDIGQT